MGVRRLGAGTLPGRSGAVRSGSLRARPGRRRGAEGSGRVGPSGEAANSATPNSRNEPELLEGKALRIESERRSTDPRTDVLELARQARSRNVPEPEPSALAHRAFQAQLAAARTVEELKALRERIESFLPDARKPGGGDVDLARWEAPYANDPAEAYRSAPEAVRAALDRRLWADTTQRLLEARMRAEPKKALALAEEADAQLPDRPAVVAGFFEEALAAATKDPGALRQADVEKLATLYREKLGKPDEARLLLRRWLDDQRLRRLSPTDAEGRVSLAGQYESMLGDRATAAELLRSAWKIDPQSKDVADAFRRRGFRKVNDRLGRAEPDRGQGRRRPGDRPPTGPRRHPERVAARKHAAGGPRAARWPAQPQGLLGHAGPVAGTMDILRCEGEPVHQLPPPARLAPAQSRRLLLPPTLCRRPPPRHNESPPTVPENHLARMLHTFMPGLQYDFTRGLRTPEGGFLRNPARPVPNLVVISPNSCIDDARTGGPVVSVLST